MFFLKHNLVVKIILTKLNSKIFTSFPKNIFKFLISKTLTSKSKDGWGFFNGNTQFLSLKFTHVSLIYSIKLKERFSFVAFISIKLGQTALVLAGKDDF